MSYSELRAIAQRDDARRADAAHRPGLQTALDRAAAEGPIRRVSRRLVGRGPRPAHALEGEAAPRARCGEPPDTAPA